METFSQKYTIIQLLENLEDGAEYSYKDWPLHVTLADVFAIDLNDTLLTNLASLTGGIQKFETTVGEDTLFGENQEVRVRLLNKNEELVTLHLALIDLLEKAGAVFNNPEYTKDGFVPHITVQSHLELEQGDKVQFSTLTIVDMFPNEDPYQRKLLQTFRLGE